MASKKKQRAIVFIILVLGFALWRIIAATKPDFVLETTEIKKGQLIETLSASGKIVADQKVDLTFQISGALTWVGVKEGDQVVKGQAIASLDKKQLQFQLEKILNSWEREFSEFDDTNDSVSDEVLTDAVRRIKSRAQIDLDQTQIDVEIQNEAIRLASLNSPFSGIVTQTTPAYSGVNVSPATAIYSIVNPETVYFEAEVNELDVTKVSPGQEVIIELDAYPGEKFMGKVESIDFASITTSAGGTAYQVRIGLPENANLKFRLGMSGDVEFILQISMGLLTLPQTSVVEEDSKAFVWTIEEGKARKTQIETGVISTDEVEIVSGLVEKDLVILRPPAEISDGDRVKIKS